LPFKRPGYGSWLTASAKWPAAIANGCIDALAAWADPAVWDRELDMMGAKTPAADVGALIIAELVLHGWDLAAATGQD
jgi:uncharacterized protein (TIGR03086 family)